MTKAAIVLLLLLFLLIIPSCFAFSITDYQNNVKVNDDGSINVYEKMTFYLEQEYSEGYRSIRKEDFSALSDITLHSAKVNGAAVTAYTQMNGDQAEIVWKKTYAGTNVVELNYTIKDRVQLYNDFAKLCFEHYGADWSASASRFTAMTTLPAKSAGKTMHFEVYSTKQGTAYIDNLTVTIEMDSVPAGNYVGACYLFDRDSVNTSNTVDASAYSILKSEREIYGSKTIIEAEKPNLEYCCIPVFLISLVVAISFFLNERSRSPSLPESILPPGKEEPAVVSALVRNTYDTKELLSATIVSLISRGIIDIVELEKKDAEKGAEIKRERTILMLKKEPAGLKDYERTVISFIFGKEREVDLDAKMDECNRIKSKSEAGSSPVVVALEEFNKKFPVQIESLFTDTEIKSLSDSAESRKSSVVGFAFLSVFALIFVASFFSFSISSDAIDWYFQHGETLMLGLIVFSAIATAFLLAYPVLVYIRPKAPKSPQNQELYSKWDAFYRGLKASKIKEYPPASAVIWGEILTYATALGLAKKVETHLSELDAVLAKRIERIDYVGARTVVYYTSAMSLSNLATYGNRQGVVRSSGSHGGFSSYSSGGWSSGGGGGFSGGSSGGGGFR